jgi:DNA/RNA endonuclease G (NUC1)
MTYSVRCPIQFWKICVLQKEDGSASATAFVLGQEDIKDLPGFEQEVFDVGAAQVTLEELEHRTGLSFSDLKDHDHFADTGEPTLEALVINRRFPRKAIRRGEDILV